MQHIPNTQQTHDQNATLAKVIDILRIREHGPVQAVVNDEAVALIEKVLSTNYHNDLDSELSEVVDIENLLGMFIHLLDNHRFKTEEARRKARSVVLKLGEKMKAPPSCLLIKQEEVTIKITHPVNYGDISNVYMGDYLGSAVSLKRIRARQMNSNLYREALAWRTVSHTYVLPFIGIYADYSQSFISLASPFMSNGVLSQWRKEKNPAVSDIQNRILEVAQGLSYLHQEGIVHGELRAGHVMIDHESHVKIANFGLTLHSDSTATLGTIMAFHFAAPELFMDDDEAEESDSAQPTEKADVYAFGCFYYELHFDVFPFGNSNIFAVGKKVLKGIRPPRMSSPQLDDQAWGLIERCWSQDPVERPNMNDVVETIESWG